MYLLGLCILLAVSIFPHFKPVALPSKRTGRFVPVLVKKNVKTGFSHDKPHYAPNFEMFEEYFGFFSSNKNIVRFRYAP